MEKCELCNETGKFVTFIPDEVSYVCVTLTQTGTIHEMPSVLVESYQKGFNLHVQVGLFFKLFMNNEICLDSLPPT